MAPPRLRKVSLAVALEPEQYDAVRRISAQTRIPMAVHMRDAVAEWLERHAAQEKLAEAEQPKAGAA